MSTSVILNPRLAQAMAGTATINQCRRTKRPAVITRTGLQFQVDTSQRPERYSVTGPSEAIQAHSTLNRIAS